MKSIPTLVIGAACVAWLPAQAAAQTPAIERAEQAPPLTSRRAEPAARPCSERWCPDTGRPTTEVQAARPASPDDGAAQPAPLRLTLDAAIQQAVSASHRIGELRARQESARAASEGREAADRPQVSAQAGYARTNHVDAFGISLPGRPFEVIYPDIPDNYRARLDLQWPIYTFGRTAALERLARTEVEATGKDVEAGRADLTLDVTRAFWALVTARESVRVLESSLKRMDAALQDVQNRQKVGLVPPSDVLSVQAQRSRQQMLLILAQNQLDVSRADLARLAGLPPDAAIEPEAALDQPAAPSADIASLADEARRARPERQALVQRLAGAGERRVAAAAATRPVLAIAGGLDYARPNPRIFPRIGEFRESWDASVSFSWLLWDGGRTRADIAEATATERATAERLAEFDRALDVEVRQRWLDTQSSRAAVGAALDSVNAATEARRVVEERFRAGVATTTEVLDAQVALLQAELDRTQALASVRLADARLARAVGR
jgi:outer membrane protein TolC